METDKLKLHVWGINGKEPIQRIAETTGLGVSSGLVFSGLALCHTFPKTFTEAALRTVNHTVTLATLGAVFGASTTISATMRGKDSPLNYFIGGCMTGAVFGAKHHNYVVGTGTCVALGGSLAFFKLWNERGWGPLVPPPVY